MARATQSSETPPESSTKNQAPSAPPAKTKMWQSDPTVQDIHNAFILGWSLVELRSRIQVAALDDTKLPTTAVKGLSKASLSTADPLQLVTATNDRLLRASRMRTIFNSIVTLQRAKFPKSATVNTLYDPPKKKDLAYLYPAEPDYANIGINLLEGDEDGKPIWQDFRLYDITRRAINCLTLLLVIPEDSLIPTVIQEQQCQLTEQIMESASQELKKDRSSDVRSLATTAVDAYKQTKDTQSDESAARTDHGKAITTLSFLTVRLLQAWDGYLRERLTAEGVGANNLLTLVAYEAGRNMAAISWNTSVNTILLENQATAQNVASDQTLEDLYQAWKKAFTDSNLIQSLHQITALSAILDEAYCQTKEKPLPAADGQEDDLLVKPDLACPSQVLQAVKQSVEYWRHLVLWLDTPSKEKGADGQIKPGPKPRDQMKPEAWQNLRNALIEQSGIWFNLMTGQQDLRGFTVESITHEFLDEAIKNFSELAQRDFPAAAREASQKVGDIVDAAVDAVADVSENATRAAKNALNRLFGSCKPWLLVVGAVGLVAVAYFIYLLGTGKIDGASLVTGLGTLIASLLSWLGINKAKSDSEKDAKDTIEAKQKDKTDEMQQKKEGLASSLADARSNLTGAIGNAFGQAGNFLVQAYDKGLQRIQIELQLLNAGVSVTHPLVEFLVRHYAIQGDFDFLAEVIWDTESRKAQLRRVVNAAFGPLSILLGATSLGSSQSDPHEPVAQSAD